MRPREECKNRAGMARLIAEIEMIGAGIVEIDGLLDESQNQYAGVDIKIAIRADVDRGHMINTHACHGIPPSEICLSLQIGRVPPNCTFNSLRKCNIITAK